MRKLLTVSICVFALAACGSKTYYVTEAPSSTETTTTTTTKAPRVTTPKPVYTTQPSYDGYFTTSERNFIDSIYALFPDPIYVSDEEMIETGYMTCASLEAGMTGDQLINTLIASSGGDDSIFQFVSTIAAAAIAWFCPDQSWKIN